MHEPGKTFKFVTLWLLLLTVAFLAMLAVQRWRTQPRLTLQAQGVVLARAPDGQYHWPGRINQHAVVFLMDTGASRTTLPGHLARELGLPLGESVPTETAAGKVFARHSQADLELDGGPSASRWTVLVVDEMRGPPLLGMDILGQLSLSQRDGQLSVTRP